MKIRLFELFLSVVCVLCCVCACNSNSDIPDDSQELLPGGLSFGMTYDEIKTAKERTSELFSHSEYDYVCTTIVTEKEWLGFCQTETSLGANNEVLVSCYFDEDKKLCGFSSADIYASSVEEKESLTKNLIKHYEDILSEQFKTTEYSDYTTYNCQSDNVSVAITVWNKKFILRVTKID